MDKKTFIKELKQGLRGMPKEEIKDIISDYEEHFAIGKKKKRTEAAIAKKLGKPKELAKQLKAETAIKKAEKEKTTSNIFKAVLATIGLGFFNIIIVLGPFIGLLAIIISLFATGLALAISGIVVAVVSILSPLFIVAQITGATAIGGFFIGIGLLCFGLLFMLGTYYVGKGFAKITLHYLKYNVSIIKGRNE